MKLTEDQTSSNQDSHKIEKVTETKEQSKSRQIDDDEADITTAPHTEEEDDGTTSSIGIPH